ncbi:MAG: ROK family protein, partial [Actinobacteria bacterium]|nr:ROK family protein [Actinomycetota bacterium]
MTDQHVLGIDIGGSGIKGAMVDLTTGEFASDRLRIVTPQPSTPANVALVVKEIVDAFADEVGNSPIGVTIPAVVTHGVTRSAANIDKSWIDAPAEAIFGEALGWDIYVMNDADAAGVAEVIYGAAKGHQGLVIVTTLGTGIGSAIINRNELLPNTEIGHLEIDGRDAETFAAASVREREKLSFDEYVPRLQRYYETVEKLFWPDLFVVGGGVSKHHEKFLPKL